MIRAILLTCCVCVSLFAENRIQVIYPRQNQRLPAVDSTFIFGNTNPKAKLTINGVAVPVHEEGGFLAYLKVNSGEFKFRLRSTLDGTTIQESITVYIGPPSIDTSKPIILTSISPSGRTVLSRDDLFEFSFIGSKSGQPYCRFSKGQQWQIMYRMPEEEPSSNVFGEFAEPGGVSGYCRYYGYLPMSQVGDSSRVVVAFMRYADSTSKAAVQTFIDSSDFFVVPLFEGQIKTLTVSERPKIVRVGPNKGYKLVNMPPSVRFLYGGETPEYYRVKLADDGISGYIKKSDAILQPEGTRPPFGEITYIVVNEYDDRVEIGMAVGDKLPFEIRQSNSEIEVDLFGAISNIDWIRFNCSSEFLKDLRWSQPYDRVLRLNARWRDEEFWGYDGRYEGDRFIFRIKKKPGEFRKGRSLQGIRIVVDPGHSKDSGAVGPTGLAEKDANLWIALELAEYLEKKGAEVLLTRSGNEDVPLYGRVDFAVEKGADLLVSVHNNALPDGINPFVNNGTSAYYYYPFSKPLAEKIHARMLEYTDLPDHGVYYGNLALTRISNFPAVLVECAFMMIPEQEAKLKQKKFREKIARAIGDGICDYFSR